MVSKELGNIPSVFCAGLKLNVTVV